MTDVRRWAATVGIVCFLLGGIACTSDQDGTNQPTPDGGQHSGSKDPGSKDPGSKDGDRSTPEQTETEPGRSDGPTPGEDGPTRGHDADVPQKYRALLRTAADKGSVRVIVTMRLGSTPQKDVAYRKAVADAADDIYAELRQFGVERGHTYRNVPMFAAEVNEEALRHLIRSDRVVKISRDEVERPQ